MLTLSSAGDALRCRREQLRLGGLRVPSTPVGFGETLSVRLAMPFADCAFEITGTVVSRSCDGTAIHLDPLPGELELFLDQLERSEIEGTRLDRDALSSFAQMRLSDIDDESVSVEIDIDADEGSSDGIVDPARLDEDDESDYWASLIVESPPDVAGDLAGPGLAGAMGQFVDDRGSGVLRFTLPDGIVVGVLLRGEPLLFQGEPPRDEGNLELALATSDDLDLDAFATALELQERSGESLALSLLRARAIDPDDLLRQMRHEATALIAALADRRDGTYAFWGSQVPMTHDGEHVDLPALLRACHHLLGI